MTVNDEMVRGAPRRMRETAPAPHEAIDEIVRRIVGACDPVQVILFGSCARNEARGDSDVDVLVIHDTVESDLDLAGRLYAAVGRVGVAKDIVVKHVREYDVQKNWFRTVCQVASKEGRIVYVRP